jgi:hypothetical protein
MQQLADEDDEDIAIDAGLQAYFVYYKRMKRSVRRCYFGS